MQLHLAAISLVAFIGGCFPAQSVERPAIIGRVLDSQGRCVVNANVVVRSDWNQQIVDRTKTDADGRFNRPAADRRWFIYLLSQDNPPPPKFNLEVLAANRASVVKQFEGGQVKALGIGPDKVVYFGEVRLP